MFEKIAIIEVKINKKIKSTILELSKNNVASFLRIN